jgi:hypothetical protein
VVVVEGLEAEEVSQQVEVVILVVKEVSQLEPLLLVATVCL